MPETRSLTFSRQIKAAPAEVFRAFTHPTLLRDWLCSTASTDPRQGGHFFAAWASRYQAAGWYEEFEPPHRVQISWRGRNPGAGQGDPAPTQVYAIIEAEGEGSQVTLIHAGLGKGEDWDWLVQRWSRDWPSALENLQSVVETGVDLRVTRRPRLGIWMDELAAEKAKQLGLEKAEGVLIQGTAENSGAAEAGLQKDDVLLSLNGVALLTPSSFEEALRGLQAGDTPPVEYIRAGQKTTVPLRLGSFPIPEYPATGAGLAEQVRPLFSDMLAKMRQQLAGLTDEQATRRPAEEEWSVREILAHFILTERDYQGWVAHMLNDRVVEDWLQMSPNVNPRVSTLAGRLGTVEALLAGLEAVLDETVLMLSYLPESFTRDRKHLYRRAAQWASEVTPGHYAEEHLAQLQAAIDAARK